jgi:hypothetical protein
MDTNSIIAAIDAELKRLQKARVLLSSIEGTAKKAAPSAKQPAKHRKLSAKARKAIADAQRKRWAKVKAEKAAKLTPAKKAAKKKTPAKKAAPKPTKAPAKKARKAVAKKVVPASEAKTS